MKARKPEKTARLCVPRKEFIRALLAIRRRCRKQPNGTITLEFSKAMLHMTLGDLAMAVPACGDWPAPVLVPPAFIDTVALLPPRDDPVAVCLEDGYIRIGSTSMKYRHGPGAAASR